MLGQDIISYFFTGAPTTRSTVRGPLTDARAIMVRR